MKTLHPCLTAPRARALAFPRLPSALSLSGFQAFLPAALLSLLLLPALAPSARAQLHLATGTLGISGTNDLIAADGMPVSTNLIFDGNATDSGTLVINSGANVVFDSSAGSDNHLILNTGNYGAFVLDDGATLTFSGNNSGATSGAAINVAAGARLLLDGRNGAGFVFEDNVTTGGGAAIQLAGAGSYVEIWNALFQNNSGGGSGVLVLAASSTAILHDVTFKGNNITGNGMLNADQANLCVTMTNFLVESNTSSSQGIFSRFNNNTSSATFSSGTFLNNVGTQTSADIGGGILYFNTGGTLTLNDVSFVGNRSPNSAYGGAIVLRNATGGGNLAIYMNVTSGTSDFAGNTDASGFGHSIYDWLNSNNGANTQSFNINVGAATNPDAVLNMLDSFVLASNNASTTGAISINKTGAGTWNLAGSSTISKAGVVTGIMSVNVNEGTLHLYRGGDQVYVAASGSTYAADTGNINFIAGINNANLRFTLANGARLSIGGGNTISFAGTLNGNDQLTFTAGSILSYSLDGLPDSLGLTADSPLLQLTMPGTASVMNIASTSAFNFNLNFDTWTTGTFNLLHATKNATDYLTTLGFANDAGTWQQSLLSNITYAPGAGPGANITTSVYIDDTGNLWISFADNGGIGPPLPTNLALTWVGSLSNQWLGAPNWLETANPTNPALAFSQGDVVNFDSTNTDNNTILLADTATAAGINFSGDNTYALTGTGNIVATGKLVLGALATDPVAAPAATTFTGTLDLTDLTGAPNAFAAGIEIKTGALRVSNTAQLGIPNLGGDYLNFTGTGALIIAADSTLAFDPNYTVTPKLTIGNGATIVSATILAEPGATLSITHAASTAADGGAIVINANSTLTLAGGGGFLFDSNTTTQQGAAISLAGAGASLIATSATFTNNLNGSTGGRSGGAISTSGGSATNLINITLFDSCFAGNVAGPGSTTAANGGAISGNYATILAENTLFTTNSAAATGGAIYVNQANSTATIRSSTFDSNYARTGGGAISAQTAAKLYVYDSLFENNIAATVGGGAIITAGATARDRNIVNSLFISNTALAGNGGAYYSADSLTTGALVTNFTNATFLDNSAVTGTGGAIYIADTNIAVINITATDNSTSRFAGNTDQNGASGLYYYRATAANNTGTLNLVTGSNATIDMLDPMTIDINTTAGYGFQITKTGSYGTLKLGGDNQFSKSGANTNQPFTFTVAEGTLYLYRDGEQVTDPNNGTTYTATTGNILFNGRGNANSSFYFTVKSGATLSIGGGNTFSYTNGATNPANCSIALEQGSILAFDLANYNLVAGTENIAGEGTALLTLSTPDPAHIQILTGNTLNPLLNFTYATLANGDTFNLLAAGAGNLDALDPDGFTALLQNATFNGLTYTDFLEATDLKAIADVTNDILWISFVNSFTPLPPHEGNSILTWTGSTNRWLAAPNWNSATETDLVFNQGDILNFDSTNTDNDTIRLVDTATASGINFSGANTYAMTGAGAIVTDAASGTYTPANLAATGKLILGAIATDDATAPAYADFTGTLDLTGLTGEPNNFTSGIEINTGALRVANNDQLGIPTLDKLAFTGTGALIIAADGSLLFDDQYIVAPKLTIGAAGLNVSATILAESGANLTITHAANTADGGAIIIAANSTLTLHGENGGGFLFDSNTTTTQGAVISVVSAAAGSGALIVDSATFTNNANGSTGARNGGAISSSGGSAANPVIITVRDSVFENNTAGAGTTNSNGGAIAGNYSTITAENTLFTSNSASSTGGAIYNAQASSITEIHSSTFDSNYARAGGGAISAQTNAKLYVYDSLFENNIAATVGGGAINAVGGAATDRLIQDTLFISNTALAGDGGAYLTSGGVGNVTFTNASFLDNTAATGNGGAIAVLNSPSGVNVITIAATDDSTSRFAGNTDTNGPSGFYYSHPATPNNTGTLNIITGSNATVDMLDPMTIDLATTAGFGFQITKTGSYGTLKLGGDNQFSKSGANTNQPFTFTVAEGTLYLYRDGEQVTDPNNGTTYTATTGNILFNGRGNANSSFYFTVKSGATLSIGGGNTFSYTNGATNPANCSIALEQGSHLAFDLANYNLVNGATNAPGQGTPLLTLSTPVPDHIQIITGNTLNPLLNFTYAPLTLASGDTFNLLTAGAGNLDALNTPAALDAIVQNATYNNLNYYDFLDATNFKATAGIDNDTLWISFLDASLFTRDNMVLTWIGASSSWRNPNWIINPVTTATTFQQADIINLADTTNGVTISDPAATTINIDTTTSATIAGMFVSGTTSYTITGNSIEDIPAIGTLAGKTDVATGKLVLGARALDDASALDTTSAAAYSGTLALSNTSNNFAGGIDILSGELVGNDKTLGVGPSAGIHNNGVLTFNQDDAGVYAALIAGTGTLNKTGAATLTLAADNSLFTGLTNVNAGALLLAPAATLGGNITVNAATLGGAGTATGDVTLAPAGTLQAGATHTSASLETLSIGGNLTIDAGSTLLFNLSGASNSTINVTGILGLATAGGPVNIDLSNAGNGIYTLITAGSLDANAAALTTADFNTTVSGSAFGGGRATATYIINPATIQINFAVTNISSTWTAANGNLWNTTAENWANPSDAIFYNGDAVTFDSTATGAITVDTPVTAAGMIVDTADTLAFDGASITTSTLATSLAATGKLVKLGTGTLTLANTAGAPNNFEEGIDLQAGALIGTADTLRTGINGVTTAADTTLTFAQTTDATYANNITGLGNLTKTGSGNLTLDATTDYTGATTLEAGALTLTRPNQLAASSTVTLTAGTLLIGANDQTLNNLAGAGNITGDGALTLSISATGIVNYTGTINTSSSVTISANPVILNNLFSLAGNNTMSALTIDSGFVSINRDNTISGPVTITGGATLSLGVSNTRCSLGQANIVIDNNSDLFIATGTNDYTLPNAISGSGELRKSSANTGILTLTANSSAFTGTTHIYGGTLALAPDASLGGDTILSDTTSLAGTGTLHNLTTLGSATITVGTLNNPLANGPETLALTGTLALAGPTTLNYDVYSENTSDLITAAALVRSGSDTFNIALGSFNSGTYTLITTTETLDATATAGLGILSNGNTLSERTTASFLIDTGTNLNLILITHNLPNLVWDGTNTGLWQHNQTNWQGGDVFLNGDAVIFDNTLGGTNAVTVDTAGVLTRAMTVNSGTYTYTGGPITTSATTDSSLAAGEGDGKLTIATGANVTLSNTTAGPNLFEQGITIATGASLTGNTDTLEVGAAAGIANSGTLTFNQAATGTYATPITGPGSLTKTGAGALTLTNASYTTGLNVAQGTLTLADGIFVTRGDITIATGATLAIANAPSYTIINTLTGAGSLNITLTDPAGSVSFSPSAFSPSAFFTGTLALGPSTYNLAGANTDALAAATLRLNAGNTTTVATGTQTIAALSLNGGKIDFTAPDSAMQVTTLAIATGTVQVTIPLPDEGIDASASLFAQAAGASLDRLVVATGSVTGASSITSLVLVDQNNAPVTATATDAIYQNGAIVAYGAYSHTLDATGGLNVKYGLTALDILDGADLTLAPAAGESGVFSATLSGSGAITIDATNAPVTLGKTNTAYTGVITLASGTLLTTATNALGGPAATLTQLDNTTLNTGAYAQTLGALVTAATATTNLAAPLTLDNGGAINGAITGTGALTVNGGNLLIAAANTALTGSAAATIGASGTLTLGDLAALNTRPIANAGVLNIANTTSGTLANTLTGAGALNLNNTDTLTLASTSAMTGPVAINGPVVATRSGVFGTGPVTINDTLTCTSGTLLANPLSGAGTLNLSSTNMTVTGNNLQFNGAINVLPGAAVTAATNPNALHSASINIDAATVTLAINNAILGNVTLSNAANLAFATANPGNLAQLASLNGSGTLSFNTNVGTFGNSDTLVVNGPANGAFAITIANTGTAPYGGTATRTLVDAKAGGNATYTGAGTLNNLGLYLYNWNVASDNGSAILNLTQQAAFGPAGGAIVANANGVLPLTWFSELDTLANRLGDLHISTREKPGIDLWMRAYSQRLNVNDKNTPVPFNETQYGTEVGADYGGLPNANGLLAYLGAFAGYGSSQRNLDITGVNGDTTSVHAGAYATLVSPGGWYVDLVGKFNHFKNTFTANMDGAQSMNANYTTTAFGGSVEFGKRIELGRKWYLTPSAQAAMARIESTDYSTDGSQTTLRNDIAQESATSRQLRAGFLLGRQFIRKDGQIIQPYASFHLARQWTAGGALLITNRDTGIVDPHGPYYSIIEGSRLEAGLGVNWALRKNLQVYLDYDCAWARDYQKPYGLNLGANYAW